MTLANSTVLFSFSGKSTHFTVLVDRVADPIDASIPTNDLVLRINEDDFVELVSGILIDPVRVQNTEISALATNTLFSNRSVGSLSL